MFPLADKLGLLKPGLLLRKARYTGPVIIIGGSESEAQQLQEYLGSEKVSVGFKHRTVYDHLREDDDDGTKRIT